jgi:hypothetical protein
VTGPWGRFPPLYRHGGACYIDFSLKLPMENQHPITPPPELVRQWESDWHCSGNTNGNGFTYFVAARAAQWGANQELDACCAWLLEEPLCASNTHRKLRAARRKPPSLKEQALQALSEAVKMADDVPPEGICSDQADIIRRALEQLPE